MAAKDTKIERMIGIAEKRQPPLQENGILYDKFLSKSTNGPLDTSCYIVLDIFLRAPLVLNRSLNGGTVAFDVLLVLFTEHSKFCIVKPKTQREKWELEKRTLKLEENSKKIMLLLDFYQP